MATLANYSRKRRHRLAILVDCPLDATLHQEEKGKTLLEKETEANDRQPIPLRFLGRSTATAPDSAPHPLRSARRTPHPKNIFEKSTTLLTTLIGAPPKS